MKKENNFLDLMGEIDEKFVYEASLPWEKRKVNLKFKLAKIAAAGVVIALLIGGLGHPHEIKAAWEQITSWIQTALGINENVESYIDSVGKTITKNGISITLDEIAADKENLWVTISDNINDSKEKETILLTEVEINGKAAQLDGTYALEKKENGTDGQVCHYRLEDTTIKDNTADIKMKVWLFDPTEMDTADTEDTDDYIFEFSSNWEELEKNTINVNVNKKIKISPNQNLTISKMSLNDLASTIYGNLDNKEYIFPTRQYQGIKIYFDLPLLLQSCGELLKSFSLDLPTLEKNYCGNHKTYINGADSELENIFQKLWRLSEKPSAFHLQIYTLELLHRLLNMEIRPPKTCGFYTETQVEIAKRAAQILSNDLRQHIPIRQIAERFSVSETSLKNYFRGVYGQNISTWLREIRMNEAARLLSNTKRPIAEISEQVGYSNQGKFAAVFKKQLGLSPLEYRRFKNLEKY